MARTNLHATALRLAREGLLIVGPSGSGKTALALAILSRARSEGVDACLVADDQVWVEAKDGRLEASVPEAIAGLVEIHPLGPRPVAHEPRMTAGLVIELVDARRIGRFEEGHVVTIAGLEVAAQRLPARSARRNLDAIWSLCGLSF